MFSRDILAALARLQNYGKWGATLLQQTDYRGMGIKSVKMPKLTKAMTYF